MPEETFICVDAGTTNTRVWLIRGETVLARGSRMVGVRDSARDGNNERLRTALRDLISDAARQERVKYILAGGMITSSGGLVEVPHVTAPAGVEELASAAVITDFPEIAAVPIMLVPGVKSGPAVCDLDSLSESDLMRGEETLCVGLVMSHRVPALVLNLGSHWKAVRLGTDGRVEGSTTSLSGELIHAAQTQTILASAVTQVRPEVIDEKWAEAGMKEQRSSGLARALFCVRLLELSTQGTPEQRLAFLIGAVVSSEFDAMKSRNVLTKDHQVIVTGGGAIGRYWKWLLTTSGYSAKMLTQNEVETAYLNGLRAIWQVSTG